MMKALFENTSMEYIAETSTSWRDLINELREFFQCPAIDETSLFYELLNLDCTKLTVKQALMKMYGIVQKAKSENVLSILPNPVIIVPKVVSWFPPTSHSMLKERFQDVGTKTTWEDLLDDLKDLMMEAPPELKCTRQSSTSRLSGISVSSPSPKTQLPRPKTTGAIDSDAVATTTQASATRGPVVAPRPTITNINKNSSAPAVVTVVPKAKAKAKTIGRLMKNDDAIVGEFRIDTGADDSVFGKDLLGFVQSLGPAKSTYSVPLSTRHAHAEACEADVSIRDVNGIPHPMKLRGIINPGNNLSVLSVKTATFVDGQGTFRLPKLGEISFPCHSRGGFPHAKVEFNSTTKSLESFLSQLGFTAHPKPSIEDVARAVHLKFGCSGTDTLYFQCAILGFSIQREICRMVASSCHICPHKSLHAPLESIRSEDIIAPNVTSATLNEAELKILADRLGSEERTYVEGVTTEPKTVTAPPTMTPTKETTNATPQVVVGVPAPTKREIELENDEDAAMLDALLFGTKIGMDEDGNRRVGALNATEVHDVLVLDYCHWGPNNVLVMKLEGRGLYFLKWTVNRTSEPAARLIARIHPSLRAVVCDNAPEFLKLRRVCENYGVEFNPTHLGRQEVKGRQESAVKCAK